MSTACQEECSLFNCAIQYHKFICLSKIVSQTLTQVTGTSVSDCGINGESPPDTGDRDFGQRLRRHRHAVVLNDQQWDQVQGKDGV